MRKPFHAPWRQVWGWIQASSRNSLGGNMHQDAVVIMIGMNQIHERVFLIYSRTRKGASFGASPRIKFHLCHKTASHKIGIHGRSMSTRRLTCSQSAGANIRAVRNVHSGSLKRRRSYKTDRVKSRQRFWLSRVNFALWLKKNHARALESSQQRASLKGLCGEPGLTLLWFRVLLLCFIWFDLFWEPS